MIENPYLPAEATCDPPPTRNSLLRDLVPLAFAGLLVAFVAYGIEAMIGVGLPLKYSFPLFYPIRDNIYFNPLFGFCVQCMLYALVIGWSKHFGRLNVGLWSVVSIHVTSVLWFLS